MLEDTNMKVSGQKLMIQETKAIGVHVDRTLSFDEHVSKVCKNVRRKLSVLASLSNYVTLTQRRVLMNTFIEAQFGYCPVVWMFDGILLNKKTITYRSAHYELYIETA